MNALDQIFGWLMIAFGVAQSDQLFTSSEFAAIDR